MDSEKFDIDGLYLLIWGFIPAFTRTNPVGGGI